MYHALESVASRGRGGTARQVKRRRGPKEVERVQA